MLLGHTCVCAVEIEPYCRKVLLARQRDGILPKFPIWDDVRTFDGKPWRLRDKDQSSDSSAPIITTPSSGWFVKLDQNQSSWRTAQTSLFEGLDIFLETWPRWGMMRDGACWALSPPASLITDSVFGLLPTPLASDDKGGSTTCSQDHRHQWKQFVFGMFGWKKPSVKFTEKMQGLPDGWLRLEPVEISKFQQWLNSHGKHLANDPHSEITCPPRQND
jgi:hypothetical protein